MVYEYVLRDHLGNTRVMFTDSDGNGQPEALQEDNYYPFGLKMADGAMQPSQATVHLYNGKELQDELGLGWYDYGARMLNPTIGRWNGVDALARDYLAWSPFNYTMGNPIRLVDPDGKKVKPSGDAALTAIKNTLSAEDAAYVVLDENGYIDNAKIQSRLAEVRERGKRVSSNFSDLAYISGHKETVEVGLGRTVPYKKADGSLSIIGPEDWGDIFVLEGEALEYAMTANPPNSLTSTNEVSESGALGRTTLGEYPDGSGTRSGNMEVIVHKDLTERGMAEVMGHELYTHVYINLKYGNIYGQHEKRNEEGQVVEGNGVISTRDAVIMTEIAIFFMQRDKEDE